MHPMQRLLTLIPMIEKKNLSTHSRCSIREYIRSAEKIMIDGDIVVETLVLVRRCRAIFAKGSCTRRNCDAFLLAADADVVDAISMCKSSYRMFVLERFWQNWMINELYCEGISRYRNATMARDC